MDWTGKKVLITGGASFIGATLSRELVRRRANVRVADNLSSGRLSNLQPELGEGQIEFLRLNLLEHTEASKAMRGVDIVFHLAADHGGRGYITLHQAACATNLALDGIVIKAACDAGVDKFVFASSGCVYPNYAQVDTEAQVFLAENMVKPPYDADNLYGWAKLMSELTLKAYYEDYGFKSAACRYFTVYGPLGSESHAILAMIARAYLKQDPFEIWGDGQQIRNWTYIDDIVNGTLLAAEKISDATAINLGTDDRIRVAEAARLICDSFNYYPKFLFRPEMPVGPRNRVADNSLAHKLLGWVPTVSFAEGIARTTDWYRETKDNTGLERQLERLLVERG